MTDTDLNGRAVVEDCRDPVRVLRVGGRLCQGERVAQALGVPLHPQAFSSEEIEDAMTRRESEGVLTRVFGAMGVRTPRTPVWKVRA